jgi:dihydrodipicolinate synthase/N-acetylneuraminate lyase
MSDIVLTPSDFSSSVVAVPPIALTPEFAVATEANRALARHIEKGGVKILLYGGNANLYHYGLDLYAEALAMIASVASGGTRVITSIGPDFGKAMDQIPLVERAGLKNVMLLPVAFPSDSHGVGVGVRRIAERLGHGVILYIKREGYVKPVTLKRLIDEGAVSFVKYAVERTDPSDDPYLDSLVADVGIEVFASGMGETPIVDHIGRGLQTFTSGAVCIAPAAAMRLLALLKAGRSDEARPLLEPFLAFERVRAKLGGIQVLHDAVSAHVADMGPLLPFISNIKPQFMDEVRGALAGIVAAEAEAVALA